MPDQASTPDYDGATTMTAKQLLVEAERHRGIMEEWAGGTRSNINSFLGLNEDRTAALAHCEQADAAMVVRHAAAFAAYAQAAAAAIRAAK